MAFHATGGFDPARLLPTELLPPKALPVHDGGRVVQPTRVKRLRRRRALKSAIVAAGVLTSVSIVSGAWAKDVTLVIGGKSHEVRTRSASVEDLLDDQGLPLTIGLQVQPPPSTALADGMTVFVSPPPGVPADGLSVRRCPPQVWGSGWWSDRRRIRSGRRNRRPRGLLPSRPVSGLRASPCEPSCRGRYTTYRPTRARPGRSLRPWGSNPTLTIASSRHPAPPFTTAAPSATTRSAPSSTR